MPPAEHTIGRYQIIRRLGEGGMGTVYLARDPEIGREVALKVLRVDSPEYRRRFKIEVTAAGSLRNRHIVTIFDSGVHEGLPFLAMEFLPGETLADKIARQEALPLDVKLRYAQELCEGLAHAHKAGVIHRDIKPANIAIDRDDNSVKILDFGIARAVDINTTGSGVMVGTLTYMSPEQVSGRAIDHRTDIFSAGLVLYELLSYRQAFAGGIEDGVPYRIVHDEPPRLETLMPALDRRVIGIVDRALKKDPNARYADAASMANDLRIARERLDLTDSSAAATTWLPGAEPTSSKARRLILVAGVVSLLIAAVVAVEIVRRDADVSSPPPEKSTPATVESARETVPLPAADAPAPQPPAQQLPQPVPQISTSAPSSAREVDPRRAERLRLVSDAERLYAAGDGQRTLDAVETALRTYPRDPDLERLLRRLHGDAERRVDLAEARASGALGNRASQSTAFRRGQDRRADTKAENDVAARIRTLWAAADLFDLAATERAEDMITSAPARSPDPQPQPPPATTPAALEPPRAAPAEPLPPRMTAAPPSADEERAAIERTLNEYRSAYEALDVRRVVRVYPSLPNADALARAFADAREVRIGFSRPTIVLTAANTATATFNRTQEIVPKVGKAAPVDKRTLRMELRKDPLGVWLITAIK